MAEKKTELSIILRAVDRATAKVKAINDRIDAATKPIRDFKKQLGELREKSGLDDVISGFSGVGSALAGILSKLAAVGGIAGVAVAGLFHLVGEFDDLGDKAERLGVSVDFLAQMRFAAEKAGAPVEALDSGLQAFSQSLGQARAGTGRMLAFLQKVSPALAKQLKGAKSNEAAFDLMADAMTKLTDPAKRAALAQKVFGDAALAPLLAKGSKGVKELRERYLELAGSQQGAADEAGKVDDSMHDFKAAIQGIKAALVEGLAPALKLIVDRLREWLRGHRGDIAAFAKSLGEKIPAAVNKLVEVFKGIVDFIRPFVDSTTKLKIIAVALAAVIVGPLVSSIYALGVALLTTPVGWIVAGIAAIAAGAILLIRNWDSVAAFFVDMWDAIRGKFRWAVDLILPMLNPFIDAVEVIIDNWGPIKDFFVALWDSITSVFQSAWNIIQRIVDDIKGAVSWVADKADWIAGKLGLASSIPMLEEGGPSPTDIVMRSMQANLRAQSSQAKITVDFANAPRGMRATTAPQSTADVNLSVGYNMLAVP